MNFLYFGRLDKEKWVNDIIYMLNKFLDIYWKLDFHIFIFWKWKYEQNIKLLTNRSQNIHFFWYKPLEFIMRYVDNCNYTLMPSIFIETFWLSALNSLSRWLPVIWYKKWWLKEFIIADKLDINKYIWKNWWEKLFNLINYLLHNKVNYLKLKEEAVLLSNKFHKVEWEKNIKKYISKNKKILIVSDFNWESWWIETYVKDVKKTLNWIWFYVDILYWTKLRNNNFFNKIKKYIWILISIFNIVFTLKLHLKLKKHKYNIFWFNSISRRIWWLWIYYIILFYKSTNYKLYFTFHDMWYFYPYPNLLANISNIKYPLTLKNLFNIKVNFFKKIPIIIKWFNIILIKNILKKYIDIFFVPSEFMIDIVSKSYNIDKTRIKLLQHFIQN